MSRLPFFSLRYALPLSLLIGIQAATFYSTSTPERELNIKPLSTFPAEVEGWKQIAEYPTEEEVQRVLRASDTLNRSYAHSGNRESANLFIAFFRSQKTGAAPHSPKNCLPGSGWAPSASGMLTVDAPGWDEPISVNRYIVSRGDQHSLVLYWYQTAHRVIASEYLAKIWLVLDSVRYRRSDTSLVRVVVPFDRDHPEQSEATATSFVRTFFPAIREALPH